MPLTHRDEQLLRRCLNREPQAWKEFVDRFLGLVYHVIRHTVRVRRVILQAHDADDLAAEVMVQFVRDDFRILRHFRGESSLASYLAVVIRRVIISKLSRHRPNPLPGVETLPDNHPPEDSPDARDEVEHLLQDLDERDAELLRGIYLENKTYRQISQDLGIPENSVGPLLARLKAKMRKGVPEP